MIASSSPQALRRLPPIDGAELDGVFALRFLTDADAIMAAYGSVRRRGQQSSAGVHRLEVAESLKEIGMDTTIVEVDDTGSQRLRLLGCGEGAEHLKEKGRRRSLHLREGRCEMVRRRPGASHPVQRRRARGGTGYSRDWDKALREPGQGGRSGDWPNRGDPGGQVPQDESPRRVGRR